MYGVRETLRRAISGEAATRLFRLKIPYTYYCLELPSPVCILYEQTCKMIEPHILPNT